MHTTENKPNIFGYNDFRQYISDYQSARLKHDRSFSRSTFSKMLGLPNTRSYVSDVINGKNMSPEFVERLIGVLAFDKNEANYFRILVKYNQCENPDERTLYFEQLIALNRTPRRTIEKNMFEYYRHWYHCVIRALLNFSNFKDDYADLASKLIPPITVKQAKDSIKLLSALKFIVCDKDGFYRPAEKAITTPEFVRDELIKQFQMQCFELARRSVVKSNNSEPGMYVTNTISISSQAYKVLENCIEKFRSEIRSLSVKDDFPSESVYNISLALVPVSKKEKL
jgi:uncharacterized protein (TIGR02147 family)